MKIEKIGAYAAKRVVEQLEDVINDATWHLEAMENNLNMLQEFAMKTDFRPGLFWYFIAKSKKKNKVKYYEAEFFKQKDAVELCAAKIRGFDSDNTLASHCETKIGELLEQWKELSPKIEYIKNGKKTEKEDVKRIEISELLKQPFKQTALGILLWYPEYRILSWIFYAICLIILISIIY